MKKIAAIAVFLQFFQYSFGQVFVTTDNYKDVNKNYFITNPNVPVSTGDEMKYLISSMRIAEGIRNFFNAPADLVYSQAFLGTGNKFIMHKLGVAGYMSDAVVPYNIFLPNWGHLNLVVIRPNDNVIRPCIMLTNGAGEGFRETWTGTLNTAASLLMRGYVVVVYENAFSALGMNPLTRATTNFPLPPATASGLPAEDQFRTEIYGSVQCGTAALQVLTDPSNNNLLKINTSQIYAAGGSWGGGSSVAFGYADDNAATGTVNFNHALFTGNNMGSFTKISRWPNSSYRNVIKAVACLGGGSPYNDPKIGNLFDAQDHAPILFLHALRDSLVEIQNGGFLPPLPGDGRQILADNNMLGGPAKQPLLQELNNKSIKYNTYINCDLYSEHVFGSGFKNYNVSSCYVGGYPSYQNRGYPFKYRISI